MNFVNHTPFPALAFWGLTSSGESFHVVVLRQTYTFRKGPLTLSDEQTPLCEEDAFTEEPNQSSVLAESDLCHLKPRCDILVNATAYAPQGQPARSWTVGLQVRGTQADHDLVDKTLLVSGPSFFRRRNILLRLAWFLVKVGSVFTIRKNPWKRTRPGKVLSLPIRYEFAYGGQAKVLISDRAADRVKKRYWLPGADRKALREAFQATGEPRVLAWTDFEPNPIGRGFARAWWIKAAGIRSLPAPQIEAPSAPFTPGHFFRSLQGKGLDDPAFRPQGLGALGKGWSPRRRLAGTADDAWIQSGRPIPEDFDFAIWNGAPLDQQVPYLRGDETLRLTNLCPAGTPGAITDEMGNSVLQLELPGHQPYVLAGTPRGLKVPVLLDLDTLHLDPDRGSLVLVWRTALPAESGISSLEACMLSRDLKADGPTPGDPPWPAQRSAGALNTSQPVASHA